MISINLSKDGFIKLEKGEEGYFLSQEIDDEGKIIIRWRLLALPENSFLV